MLFFLQNSQNRDTNAVNIKLDELLRAIEGARTGLANVGERRTRNSTGSKTSSVRWRTRPPRPLKRAYNAMQRRSGNHGTPVRGRFPP